MKISPSGFIDYELPPVEGLKYANQQGEGFQEQEFQEEPTYPGQAPYPEPGGAVFPGQDQGFLKWLFDFRKEAIIPLRNVWRGKEYNFQTETWVNGSDETIKIMNEKGITWGISLIESYMNPAFIVTDLDEQTYAFRMREATRVIWNCLSLRYNEFDLRKSDIHRVAEEIESKISAILRGALDNGYRDFFSTQNQTIETKNLTPMPGQPKPNVWSKTAQFFRTHNNQPPL